MSLRKIHYYSGLTLTLFIGFHLVNHFVSIFGVQYHLDLMDSFRVVYRNILVETVLLAAVLVQILSGLKLAFSKKKVMASFYEKVQVYSGLYLAFFLVIHVSAVLFGRLVLEVDTNFYFGVAGLNAFPLSLFFVPYYSLGIMSFFGHIAAVHAQKMDKTILGLSPKAQSHLILLKGVILTLLILYGSTNGFMGVDFP
ncbi:hypothetical protein [Arcticibacterium luteifluviistationis]|uniref:Succinate dehydrogenase n=1 Tax=Arcticibacterium luteifluviistationis TaxID=1784714 RepID=A0A2Z4GG87_9BACT|nr:hypothetical protein [Arcticibacterium luteifluviistationis]AWW00410.1 hypothetical protein DJ013_20410 [Arcticibacterium luteifluviistationis]